MELCKTLQTTYIWARVHFLKEKVFSEKYFFSDFFGPKIFSLWIEYMILAGGGMYFGSGESGWISEVIFLEFATRNMEEVDTMS